MKKVITPLCLAAVLTLTACSKTESVSEPSKPVVESNSTSAASTASSTDSVPANIEKPKIGDLMGPEDLPSRGKAFCICTETGRNMEKNTVFTDYVVYDEHNNIIALIGEGSSHYYTYEYDKDGNITKKYDSRANASEEYEYKNGLAVKRHYTGRDGQTLDETYEYDEHGTLIKTTHYTAALDYTTVDDTKPEYDAGGRLVRETYYLSDGSVFSVDEYEYNDKGEIVKETSTGDGSKTEKEYVRDERGNVLSELYKVIAPGKEETRTEYEYNADNKITLKKKCNIVDGTETLKNVVEYVYEY